MRFTCAGFRWHVESVQFTVGSKLKVNLWSQGSRAVRIRNCALDVSSG